jgi:hypothetical protein
MIDQKTINREYPVPHPDNMLEEDVSRIKDSFEKIDIDVNDLYGTTTQSIENAQSGTYWYAVSTGTGSAYEINLTPPPTALVKGMFIHMKSHVKNSGPVTVDVNSLGVKNIQKIDGSDLKQGDIPVDGVITLIYDGTQFQLANSAVDKEQTGVNTSNIMRAFGEIQENHGGALLMETGWSDSFGNANEQGADETNSSGFQHDNTNKLYKGTDPGSGLISDKNYDTESDYLQQEWTNSNQATSQATVADGSVALDQDTASTGEFINWWRSGEIFQAQSLTPSAGIFHSFKVNLRSVGSPTHVLVGKIYAESGDQKTGPALYTSNTYNASNLTGTFQEVEFIFTGFTPDGATKYVFSVEGDDVGDVSNYIQIEGIVGAATFAGGANSYDNTLSTRDLQMKVYFISNSVATISSGVWPTNCENGRISFDTGSTWHEITVRDSDTQLTLVEIATNGTFDYIIRMSELDSGSVKLNSYSPNPNVKLLLHFNGDYADSSGNGHGSTNTSTTFSTPSNAKFGSNGLYVSGGGIHYLDIDDSDDWHLSGDFTIDFWWQFDSSSTYAHMVEQGDSSGSGTSGHWSWQMEGTNATPKYMYFEQKSYVGGVLDRHLKWKCGNTFTTTNGTYYHIAIERVSGTYHFYLDGTHLGTTTTDTDIGSGPVDLNYAGPLRIGNTLTGPGGGTQCYREFDEFRLVNGQGMYGGSSFSVETSAYLDASNVGNKYVSACDSEAKITDTSGWTDINSGSVSEALNLQDAYYWLTFDPAANFGTNTEVKIFNQTGSAWRTIAKNNGSAWEYNDAVYDTTKVLLHGDGTDGSTTFTDSGPSGYAFTAYGNAQIDTAQSKFGGSSMLFDGTGDYVRSDSASDDFSIGTSDFTLDYWVKFTGVTGSPALVSVGDSLGDGWYIHCDGTGITQFTLYYSKPGHTSIYFPTIRPGTIAITTGQWYHHAWVKTGQTYRFFEDGVLRDTSGILGEVDCGIHSSSKFTLGTRPLATPSGNYFDGWLDEVRFSKSALWTSSFTPPTNAHTYVSGAASDYTGVAADTDNMLHAVSQAVSAQPANRMEGSQLADITDADWEASGGWSTSVDNIIRGVTLYSNASTQNPSVSQYSLNHDSLRTAMDIQSKTYDPGFVPVEGYVWSQIEHSDSDGPGTFYVSRNGGTEWTPVTMTQQGLPLSGDIRIYRGIIDISGQISGQDLRCRHQTEQGKDQFLHAWGLQAKS